MPGIGPFLDPCGRRVFVGVCFGSVTTPATPGGDAEARARGAVDGMKARQMVAMKHRRYPPERNPGAALVPFALEAHGRWSGDALSLLSHVLPQTFPDRAAELTRVQRAISVLTQSRLGDMLLAAGMPPVQ